MRTPGREAPWRCRSSSGSGGVASCLLRLDAFCVQGICANRQIQTAVVLPCAFQHFAKRSGTAASRPPDSVNVWPAIIITGLVSASECDAPSATGSTGISMPVAVLVPPRSLRSLHVSLRFDNPAGANAHEIDAAHRAGVIRPPDQPPLDDAAIAARHDALGLEVDVRRGRDLRP